MRVGLVCPYDLRVPGGVQAQVIGLQRSLIARGHDVELVAPGAEGIDLGSVRRIRANRSVAPIALGASVGRAVRRHLRGCDIVHVHEPFMPVTSWAALRSGRPTVATFHAAVPAMVNALYGLGAPLGRRRLGSSTVTAVSETAAVPVRRLGVEVAIVPNGVSVPSAVLPQSSRQGVVFIGRDEPRKGLALLLAAWTAVRQSVPDAVLTIAGRDGPSSPGIRYVGTVTEEEKVRLLAEAAVLCAPNLGGESFGIVVAEGMAAGCVVACSDLAAFVDVGGDGLAAFPTGDGEALTTTLVRLLRNESERARLASKARARASAYSWESVTSAYLSTYERARSR